MFHYPAEEKGGTNELRPDTRQDYLKGKGKGSKGKTSGKGFGRRGNPKDRDGLTSFQSVDSGDLGKVVEMQFQT